MIPVTEIREHARSKGVPESTIERDYVQNWFLNGLYSEDRGMVFKGGTAIKKVYINDYRFSDDLDFTMLVEANEDYFREVIEDTINRVRDEAGINFEDRIVIEENLNGWEGRIFFRLVRQVGSPIRIKLDISEKDIETIVLPPDEKPISHDYSDECSAIVKVYSLQETFAEKVRSLFQRTRGRDLYDVNNLWDKVTKDGLKELFDKKCELKGVHPVIDSYLAKEEILRVDWGNSLGHQMREVPDFDSAFNGAIKILEELNVAPNIVSENNENE
ncbi:MAG: hypothetical protein AYK23_02975 [Candidatus Proteinoplasmatales archaeon SG8-5]|nr:MAG: hypothetical protein AYK23_02975 [Candidatus Proteinoplasmatales archaeon SG8-5]